MTMTKVDCDFEHCLCVETSRRETTIGPKWLTTLRRHQKYCARLRVSQKKLCAQIEDIYCNAINIENGLFLALFCVPNMLDRLVGCARVSPKSRWSLSEVSVKSHPISPDRCFLPVSCLGRDRWSRESSTWCTWVRRGKDWVGGWLALLSFWGWLLLASTCNPRGLVAVVNVQLGAYFVSRSGLQARKEGWGICPALPLNPRGSPTSVPH